jgi:ATP-dependent DNA ligase
MGIRLFTKNGYDWTGRYIELAGEAEAIEAESFIIDGETITVNEACPTSKPCISRHPS